MSFLPDEAYPETGSTLRIDQEIPVRFTYPVYFVDDLFGERIDLLDSLLSDGGADADSRALFVLDDGVLRHHPHIPDALRAASADAATRWRAADEPLVLPGGETCKNDPRFVSMIRDHIEAFGMCRHSFVVAIGGGAVLDVAGYAASTAHRGVRLIRVPTTVLAQNDSGVGVKNGVNRYGKKNFLGAFAPPHAVINDFRFLDTLEDRDWRAGASEAVKVALIKDAAFFSRLEQMADRIAARDAAAMRDLVVRCARLHLEHIRTSGDPFEMGSSRPLDFGHWAAHKIEQMSGYRIRHGEAVAAGIALDCAYAWHAGILPERILRRILSLLEALRLDMCPRELEINDTAAEVFDGLEEFREHLGGRLTLLLLKGIGDPIEVHEVDREQYVEAARTLRMRARSSIDA